MTSDERPSKRDAFVAFLREGWVSLHLDARRPGVVVPPSFAKEPHLVLQYGRNMPIPIPDLEITDEGVSATLSFSRAPHRTQVPWSAVYVVACTDGHGVLYYEDVPQEVTLMTPPAEGGNGARAVTRRQPADHHRPAAKTDPALPTVRRLRSVPVADDEMGEQVAIDAATAAARKRRRRPMLRLVKG
jgi:stringent starvation protein B